MPDILKATLYWTDDPPVFTLLDFGGTVPVETRAITAAEAHDGNDATYEGGAVSGGSHGDDGYAQLRYWGPVTPAEVSGDISYIRLVSRARVIGVGGGDGAHLSPMVAANPWHGSFPIEQTNFANITDTMLGFPPLLVRWTNELLNACSFGITIDFSALDADYPLQCEPQLSEFKVEVWGPDDTTPPAESTPENILMVQVVDNIRLTAVIGIPKAV